MKGYGMSQTRGKEPLHQWSCMYHQSGVNSTQVSRTPLSFPYPVPPYMYLRMIVRKEIVFTPRVRTFIDMLKRFELRDLVSNHTWYVSSSRPAARNNIPDAHSPGWDQKVMVSSEERTSSGDAEMRGKKQHGHGEEELVRNTEYMFEESSNREGATQTFKHYKNYEAKVTDQMGKRLCKGRSTIIAKPSNSNKDTLDIHMYAFDGDLRQERRHPFESSILKKFLDDDMLSSVLEDILGDSESLAELKKLVLDSESFSRIEGFSEAPAPHPNMDRLWKDAASSSTSPRPQVLEAIKVLGSVNRIPVALNLPGTNRYLACGTPPSLTLEPRAEAPDNVDDDSGKRILFWHIIESGESQFESVLHSGYFLCTHPDKSEGSLELWNNPQLQQAISYFRVSK